MTKPAQGSLWQGKPRCNSVDPEGLTHRQGLLELHVSLRLCGGPPPVACCSCRLESENAHCSCPCGKSRRQSQSGSAEAGLASIRPSTRPPRSFINFLFSHCVFSSGPHVVISFLLQQNTEFSCYRRPRLACCLKAVSDRGSFPSPLPVLQSHLVMTRLFDLHPDLPPYSTRLPSCPHVRVRGKLAIT